MTETHTSHALPLEDRRAGGCGCGCDHDHGQAQPATAVTEPGLAEQVFPVTGMTCGHCVHAVTEELSALDPVSGVSVALDPEGTSVVTVTARRPLEAAEVAAAVERAGEYRLAQP